MMNIAVRAYYKLTHPLRFGFKRFIQTLYWRLHGDPETLVFHKRFNETAIGISRNRQPTMWSKSRSYANRRRKK